MESDRIMLLLLVILASVNGKFMVVGPSDPVRAVASEDAVLECQLLPDIFVSSMVVQWFKLGLDSPVHVYINGEDHIAAQHKDYRGRTELFKDELTKGNISLRIQNITRSDGGEYICSVDDRTDSERFTVGLEVVGFGCEPWIQMKGYDINGIQLVCKSTGWFPEPKIEWVSEDGHNLIQAETTSHWGSTGLVDVHSNIVIPRQSSNRLTCRVQNNVLKTEQEVTIGISGDFLPVVPVWLVPLLVAILVLTVAISAMTYWTVKHYPHMKELELWKFIIEHGKSSTPKYS
ncbi:butyrophilin subfamily 3 member A2-like [Rhincodon typus]|uniref:butyrophilin subfamily 3 member A2-like n=1 Tax=Rhincodon typus TaxID=259920 RepID=UPI00202EA160|nr:butyrophilin subfamily 3 member A2-like [Rhincodon typus]